MNKNKKDFDRNNRCPICDDYLDFGDCRCKKAKKSSKGHNSEKALKKHIEHLEDIISPEQTQNALALAETIPALKNDKKFQEYMAYIKKKKGIK